MDGWTALSNLFSIGTGLYAANAARTQSREQQSYYNEQTEMNRALGAFNAEIAMQTGKEATDAIGSVTRKMVGQQRAAFAGRGITLAGSPMMLIGETITMGSKQAQEAYFNAEVQAVNARNGAYAAVSKSKNAAMAAKYNAMSNTLNTAQQLISLGNIAKYKESTGIAPSFNIFKWLVT